MSIFLPPSWRGRLGSSLLLLGSLLLGSQAAQAQVDTYQFAASSGTFTPLVGGTTVASIQTDDNLSAVLALPFPFTFDGAVHTQFMVSSNGWLTFNTMASSNNLTNELAIGPATERPRVAPYWDDMHGGQGTASYATTGTAPNRVFTFEWLNWYRYGNSGGPSISFQVKLFETTNVVQFVYRDEPAAITNASASIGLSGTGMGPGSFLSVSDAVANPSVSSTMEYDMIASEPPTGQVYQFTPPVPSACPTPRNLTATVTTNSAVLNWSVTNASPGPFTVRYGAPGFNPTTGGTPITGITGTSTTITGLTPNTAYQFYVTQNCGGTAGHSNQSSAGGFTTNPNPAANDNCANAIVLPVSMACTTPLTGTVFGATQSQPATTNCGFGINSANDVWYRFTATGTSHTITMTSQFGAVFDVLSGTCTTNTSVYCNTVAGGGSSSRTLGGLTAGQQYFLRVYSSGPAPAASSSSFTLCIVPGPATPANDECAGALNVPVQYGTMCISQTAADNTAATASAGVPAPGCASYVDKDIWFRVTVPASGTLTLQTVSPTGGSQISDTGLAVYSGTCNNLSLEDCDDDSGSNAYSLINVTNRMPGEVLYIRAWAYAGSNTGLIAVCATSPSNCPIPTGLAAANLTNTTAQLSWTAGGTVGAGDTFELEYGAQGFMIGTGTAVTALTASSYQLTGLMPNTGYCFYVRQNCGAANGSSTYAGPFCFTTPLTAPSNDEPCGALALTGNNITGTNVGATTTQATGITLPACSPSAAPKDVWFTMTPTGTSTSLTLTGNPAGMVRVYSAPSCSGPFALVACRASAGNNQSVGTVSLTGLTAGQRYYVAVSGFGSSDTNGTFTISGTALATRARAETAALVVYPNPSSSGQLTLRLEAAPAAGQAVLVNALGQQVRALALPAATLEHTLSTRGLAAGIYTLRVQRGSDLLSRKVVIE
ncbi:hypothetical protein GCM10023185_19790 [Hymenobacter saemangeumensis]|uniref:Fibronectin type-III domain-containing protein n=1 Tax=Hymenobacter saemangeumensis TaxID=1084522 RepID=A0ABP8ID33_9BACT